MIPAACRILVAAPDGDASRTIGSVAAAAG
jgi:hypothetical protein